MKKKYYECPSVVVTNVSFSIMSGSGGYESYDPYYASTDFSEGEPDANTSLWECTKPYSKKGGDKNGIKRE